MIEYFFYQLNSIGNADLYIILMCLWEFGLTTPGDFYA